MGAPTVSKYDIYLGDKAAINGYRTRQLVRDSAPLVAPRFSTGQQGQSDLDLLKSVSVDDFMGGMFQSDWTDNTKVARLMGKYNPYNHYLYPAIAPTDTPSTAPSGYPYVKCESSPYSFVASINYSSGTTYNSLHKVTNGTPNSTNITLPVALQSNATPVPITGMAIHKGYLYVGSMTSDGAVNCHRMKIADNTWQDISGYGVTFAELRGVLYLLNNLGGIFSVTNEFAAGAATYTLIDECGVPDTLSYGLPIGFSTVDMVEFNGALWIARAEGIFRFDGVKAVKVLDLRTNDLTVYNGALYFTAGQWLYKFDGTNVTKVQFFGSGEIIYKNNMTADSDYLYIQTAVLLGGYAQGSKYEGYDTLWRIYTWDGQALSLIDERVRTSPNASRSILVYTTGYLYSYYAYSSGTAWYSSYNRFNLSSYFSAAAVTTSAQLDFETSDFDAGYPNVFKSINVFELSYKDMLANDVVTVKYQLFDGKAWGSLITLGTITSTTSNRLEITNDTNMLFKRIKFNVSVALATGSTLAVKGCSLRWTLQPRMRWRWQASLIAYGTSIIDRLGAATTQSANTLNNLITKSIKQKTPIYMLTPDYTVVKTTANAAATSIVLQGELPAYTDPYSEYPLIAILNASGVWEILRVLTVTYASATDQTTITVAERGYLGIVAAELTAGKEAHLCHRVYVTRLIRDAATLEDDTYDEQSTKATQVKREFTIELTEV